MNDKETPRSQRTIQLDAQVSKLEAEFETTIRGLFQKEVQSLFKEFPYLETISWTQYTPYFMDGDPCEFSKGEIQINGYEEYDLKSKAKNSSPTGKGELQKKLAEAIEKEKDWVACREYRKAEDLKAKIEHLQDQLKETDTDFKALIDCFPEVEQRLGCFSEDNYLLLFGDHVNVTVTATASTTDHYEHD